MISERALFVYRVLVISLTLGFVAGAILAGGPIDGPRPVLAR